jgi:alkane 1-monooxygenase
MTNIALSVAGWKDDKRYWWLTGAVVMLMPITSGLMALATGWSHFWWHTPVIIFVIIPWLDWLLGEDSENPPDDVVPLLEKDPYYRYAVYAAVVGLFVSYIWGAWVMINGDLVWHAKLGLLISLSIITGISVNTSHELGHKSSAFERMLAKIVLAPTMYGNFFVEHNRGHHVRVSTPEDPASARFGESLYAFIPRSAYGAHVSAWALEKKRLARLKKGPWTWQNDNIQAWSFTVILFAGLVAWLGWAILPFLIIQGILGSALFETVNYLEHYGLLRQKLPDGRYERCQPQHSWNSNHRISNIALFQLQRHSDHHAHPTRPYQALRHFAGIPELPNGYAAMIPLAAFPPLWFKIMDPKVVAHYNGDMTKANIKPSIRDAVIARYTAPDAEGAAASESTGETPASNSGIARRAQNTTDAPQH